MFEDHSCTKRETLRSWMYVYMTSCAHKRIYLVLVTFVELVLVWASSFSQVSESTIGVSYSHKIHALAFIRKTFDCTKLTN